MAQLVLILLQISIQSFSCFSFYCDNPCSLRGLYCEHVLLKTGDWVDISVCVMLLHYVNSTDKTNCFARFDIHAHTNGFNFKATVLNLTLLFFFLQVHLIPLTNVLFLWQLTQPCHASVSIHHHQGGSSQPRCLFPTSGYQKLSECQLYQQPHPDVSLFMQTQLSVCIFIVGRSFMFFFLPLSFTSMRKQK